jgi:hypothetical protein
MEMIEKKNEMVKRGLTAEEVCCYEGCDVEIKPEAEVPREIGMLRENFEYLRLRIVQLHKRLTGVLSKESSVCRERGLREEPQTDMAKEIRDITHSIEATTEELEDILGRLEI